MLKYPLLKSLIVHIVLFAVLALVFSNDGDSKRDPIVEVQLSDLHVHRAESPHSFAAPKPKPKKEQPKIQQPLSDKRSEASEKPETTEDKGSDHPAWEGLSSGQRNEYLASIIRLISEHRYYPRASILNEEEGTVQLRVELDTEGGILACTVVKGSGFTRLDEAAVKSVREVGKLPLPAPHTSGVVLFIPIRFEIKSAR